LAWEDPEAYKERLPYILNPTASPKKQRQHLLNLCNDEFTGKALETLIGPWRRWILKTYMMAVAAWIKGPLQEREGDQVGTCGLSLSAAFAS